MRTNYKNLQYSWETDPRIKAWLTEKRAIQKANPIDTSFPMRTIVNGKYVNPPTPKPRKLKYAPDPRTVEQINDDHFLQTCEAWDRYGEKTHIRDVKEIKTRIRGCLRKIYKFNNGTYKNYFGQTLEDLKEQLRWAEYVSGPRDPKNSIHWFEYVDYVNVRFGLNIRKDVLTDKEFEKSKLVIDVAPAPMAIGGTDER